MQVAFYLQLPCLTGCLYIQQRCEKVRFAGIASVAKDDARVLRTLQHGTKPAILEDAAVVS